MRPSLLIPAVLVSSSVLLLAVEPVSVTVWNGQLVVSAPSGTSTLPGGAGEQRLTLDVREQPLTEVTALVQSATGLNVIVAPDVLADPPLVTLQVKDMRLASVLHWIQQTTGVQAVWANEAVFFTRQPAVGDTVTRIYDVSDICTGVRDFPGPTIGLPSQGQTGGMTLFPPVAAEESRPAITPEELAEVIRRQVGQRTAH